MPEFDSLNKDYAKYRIERSKEDLEAAHLEISKMIGEAFTIRNASDYDDMFLASKADTEIQIANAEYIYQLLCDYVQNTNHA